MQFERKRDYLPWLDLEKRVLNDRRGVGLMPTPRRSCGDCTACCTTVPVAEIGKPEHEPCQFLGKCGGCSVYESRPVSCEMWSCYWALDEDVPEELRPDRSHLIIDPFQDTVGVTNAGTAVTLSVLQVWSDPRHRNAHRAPRFRELLEEVAEKTGYAALVRINKKDAILVVAPSITGNGWFEQGGPPTLPDTPPPRRITSWSEPR